MEKITDSSAALAMKVSTVDGGGLRSGSFIRGFFGALLFEIFGGAGGGFVGNVEKFAQGDIGGFGEPVGFDGGLREALLAVHNILFIRHRGQTIDGGRKAREVED